MASLLQAVAHQRRSRLVSQHVWENAYARALKMEQCNAFIGRPREPDPRSFSSTEKGLLAGIPIAVKANINVNGFNISAGSKMLSSYNAPYDATVVSRLRKEGAAICGITNMDEFGMGSATAFSNHGPTYNPHSIGFKKSLPVDDPKQWHLTAGGSSGGSAAAVAGGAALAALGSDTGGSVRLPAAFCGIVGFKPTYGGISRHGLISYASSLDTIGTCTRTVSDASFLFDIIRGPDGRDEQCLRAPRKRGTEIAALLSDDTIDDYAVTRSGPLSHDLKGLRVGIPAEALVEEVGGPVMGTWETTARLLEDAGAEVVSVSIPHIKHSIACYYVVASTEAASNLSRYDGVRYGHRAAEGGTGGVGDGSSAAALHALYTATRTEGFGLEVKRRIMMGNFAASQEARAEFYDAACGVRDLLRREFTSIFRPATASSPSTADVGVDILLTPTAPTLPWLSHATHTQEPLSLYVNDIMTIPASLAGLPAISIPAGTTPYPSALIPPGVDAGGATLPLGVQLISRHSDEDTLFRVARVLECLLADQGMWRGPLEV